jgi:hypothetical protein
MYQSANHSPHDQRERESGAEKETGVLRVGFFLERQHLPLMSMLLLGFGHRQDPVGGTRQRPIELLEVSRMRKRPLIEVGLHDGSDDAVHFLEPMRLDEWL